MGKFYRANEEFTNYLIQLGLTFHQTEAVADSEVKYYTDHTTGKQVKVDNKFSFITFLDNKGMYVDGATSFTDNQVTSFLEA